MSEIEASREDRLSDVFFDAWAGETFDRPSRGYASLMMDKAVALLQREVENLDREDVYHLLCNLGIVTDAFYETYDGRLSGELMSELRSAEVEKRGEMIEILVIRLRELDAQGSPEEQETARVHAQMRADFAAEGTKAIAMGDDEAPAVVSKFD